MTVAHAPVPPDLQPKAHAGNGFVTASLSLGAIAGFVTLFFPILLEKWGTPMTFVLFGFFCLVMCAFTYKLVPENKGKTLEQIQVELTTAGAKN